MKRSPALWLLLVSACFATAADSSMAPFGDEPVPSAESAATPRRRVFWSETQRFAASGTNQGELLELLIWAEDFAGRLSQFIGRPLPFVRGAPLLFRIEDDPTTLTGGVQIRQLEDLGGWSQRVIIINPAATDPVEVLDATALLLLSRPAQELQSPAARRAEPAMASWWWAAGVARQALPGARSLAQGEVLREWDAGRCLSVEALLKAPAVARDPLGKSYASALVGWLRSRRDFTEIADALAHRWAAGQRNDAAFLAERINAGGTDRDLEIEWELWLAALRARQAQFLPPTLADARALREALELRRTDLPRGAPDDLPPRITLELLAARRSEPWARATARRLQGVIFRLKYGRGPEVREAIELFSDFLRGVAASNAAESGWLTRISESRELRHRLREAQTALRRLESRAAERAGAAPTAAAANSAGDDLERRALLEILRDASDAERRAASRPEP